MKRHIDTSVGLREQKVSFKSLLGLLLRFRKRAVTRQHLLDLDDRLLRDIGLTRHEVLHGAAFQSNALRKQV
jgi:uncharacterized protein YjiS (DUF1127 family)